MGSLTRSAFDLPSHLSAKAEPSLVAEDDEHFAAIAASLRQSVLDLSERLAVVRQQRGGSGQQALDRDQEIHRLTGRRRTLQRYSLDLCLGRMVFQDDPKPVYVGRVGLTDSAGRRLLVDWRSPAAEPFFAATRARPLGLASRRRYRWSKGRVADYWDEVFSSELPHGQASLDDQTAFIASLGEVRTGRMRDVLATIQADQDAIIRADSRGALVVDGGPGTGKTVVALHRAAYLLYADPRLGHRRGGVLFVGPHRPYLTYVADVLPSLGEEGVQTCTLRDLVPEGADAGAETDPGVAGLKASSDMAVAAIETAVRFYEEPPTEPMLVDTPWGDLPLDATDWDEAFASAEPGTPHNEARDEILEALVDILVDKADSEQAPPELLRKYLHRNTDLIDTFDRAWPLVSHTDLVADLWSVPAYLRLCAPWLSSEEVRLLQRPEPRAWTVSDLPLLDAARLRLGDPAASRLRRRRAMALAAERAEMDRVLDHLIATDDSEMMVMSMLRVEDLQSVIIDESSLPTPAPDQLAGPFAHIVVDEAQELTDAEWQMLLLRCPSRSLTILGDRAQARRGFAESWQDRLTRAGIGTITMASLNINYRTPAEVMAEAAPVIREVLPDANVPTSVRSTGIPVQHASTDEMDSIVDTWLTANPAGSACVIGTGSHRPRPRVRMLTPELAKGLEFDLVVVDDPGSFGEGAAGAVDRYVAMTRATRELVVLTRPAARHNR